MFAIVAPRSANSPISAFLRHGSMNGFSLCEGTPGQISPQTMSDDRIR
jgi:hypothetical protein